MRPCGCAECVSSRILSWWAWGLLWRLPLAGYGVLRVELGEAEVTS